jgi:hypothetical protein
MRSCLGERNNPGSKAHNAGDATGFLHLSTKVQGIATAGARDQTRSHDSPRSVPHPDDQAP